MTDTTALEVQDILHRASRSRQALVAALQRVPDNDFVREPPGEWGAARILRHVVFVEWYWTLLVETLRRTAEQQSELPPEVLNRLAEEAGRQANTPATEPAPFPSRREALRALGASRTALESAVRALKASDFQRTFSLPRSGVLPLRFAIEHVIEHDWDHAVQITALSSP
jgi:uncharacterized damage-inducible protein DinB